MNNQEYSYMRKRGQTLLIVEGNHEKNELFRLIFRSFPELSISMDNVWIYGTNIYMLYEEIVKEYGESWCEDDIDLPLLISTQKNAPKQYKDDFTNIFLVFDYERHDPNFSEKKITQLQAYFADATDSGKLYINYPMIESYQHLNELIDPEYIERKIPVSVQPGKKYKALVRDSFLNVAVSHPAKVHDLLACRFNIIEEKLDSIVEGVLGQDKEEDFLVITEQLLTGAMEQESMKTAVYQLKDLVWKTGYVKNGSNYWEYMKELFRNVILINVDKAYRVQYGKDAYDSCTLTYKEKYDVLNEQDILAEQNKESRNIKNGYIWVLNTCIMLVAEYNFKLLTGLGNSIER